MNFYTNFLKSAEQSWFATFDRASERLILGRLVKSRQDGIFSLGGFPVSGATDAAAAKDPFSWSYDNFDNYDAYLNGKRIDYFAPPYYSQIGGQGILFSILDGWLPFPPAVKLRMFHALDSGLTAGVLTILMAWFYIEFGLFAAVTALLSALASQWLTVFGRNLWWSTWAFFLPAATVMLYFLRTRNKRPNFLALGGLVFLSMFIKNIFNGYEYITATALMMVVPFLYHGTYNKIGVSAFLGGLIKVSLSAAIAIAISVCILSVQISRLSGSSRDGFDFITYTLKKRTHLAPQDDMNSMLRETLQAPIASVVLNYLRGDFLTFGPRQDQPGSKASTSSGIRYFHLIIFFAIMSLICFVSAPRVPDSGGGGRIPALLLATWFSLLAPLSWFIIFKSHSQGHYYLNFIVWQMPFTFFGAAVTGLALQNIAARLFFKRAAN